MNKYHQEYSCNPKILEKEQDSIAKRFARNKRLWLVYGILLVVSICLLPMWMTSLICLGGLILFPASIQYYELKDKPFLVIDTRYIQYKGKLIGWNTISKIVITHDKWKDKEITHNYTILLRNHSGKEIRVDTCYFCKQEDILKGIISLAQSKNISIESTCPTEYIAQVSI
ncbi:hypothetical protein CVD28_04150 [Bacillus sp. M6-12]|uniref:hypothetical protein n=1 Tax=Bacillus sp. M6-12 TaxID=2054166 RepID=UPI000C77B865|nr:hypothetical protein [Bacillus sp. M6-12]PLS19617.1 hypothetical protein CVD28_04150 [Bacillus sp. M6-12]